MTPGGSVESLELQVVRMLEDFGLKVLAIDPARQEIVVSYRLEDRDAQ